MSARSLRIDSESRTVTVGGRKTELQSKAWQVLRLLVRRAPRVVERADIIRDVWHGNHLTGEKGLNQALWTIRLALGDDARSPLYIRTEPRLGYRWIGPRQSATARSRASASWRGLARFAVAAAGAFIMAADTAEPGRSAAGSALDSALRGERAYRVGHDIFVDLTNGCRAILKNSDGSKIGTPVLSADGTHVAFTVRRPDNSCRLITVGFEDRQKRDIGACPTIGS